MEFRVDNKRYSKLRVEIETAISRKALIDYLASKIPREKAREAADILTEFLVSYFYFYPHFGKELEKKEAHGKALYIASSRALAYASFMGIKPKQVDGVIYNVDVKHKTGSNLTALLRSIVLSNEYRYETAEKLCGLFTHIKSLFSSFEKEISLAPLPLEQGVQEVKKLNNIIKASELPEEEIRVIGNKDAVKKLETLIYLLSTYDEEKGYSPVRRVLNGPVVLDLYGDPGSGKTHLLRYAEQLLRKIYNERKRDTFIKYITMADFSSYVNRSAKNMESFFMQVKQSNERYLIIIDEFETLFFSSKSHDENAKVTGVLRRFLGDTSQTKGNWAMVLTSNADLSQDSRLEPQIRSRLNGGAVLVPGVKELDEYIELFRYKAKKGLQYGYFDLTSSDIEELAAKMRALAFSGRDLEKVVERASFLVFNEEAILLEKEEEIAKKLIPINKKQFQDIIDEVYEIKTNIKLEI